MEIDEENIYKSFYDDMSGIVGAREFVQYMRGRVEARLYRYYEDRQFKRDSVCLLFPLKNS